MVNNKKRRPIIGLVQIFGCKNNRGALFPLLLDLPEQSRKITEHCKISATAFLVISPS